MRTFFTGLNFTSSNEDGTSELAVLCPTAPKKLLCITASGTRPLDLLLGKPRELIALDINPVQNELLRLKIAAFQALDYNSLLQYLGLNRAPDRWALHQKVETQLSTESQSFWRQYKSAILNGIWYAGLWERLLCFGAALRLRKHYINHLFQAKTLEEQAHIWHEHFENRLWRFAIRLIGRRWFWSKVIGEPGGVFLPQPRDIETRLVNAFHLASQTFFFRDSHLASLILRGKHQIEGALPPHLQRQNFIQVRETCNRIHIVNGGLSDMLALGIDNVDAFSLSDFGSYCDQAAYDMCWRSIVEVATPGARYCEREFLNPFKTIVPKRVSNFELSAELSRSDKAFIYKIHAGNIL